MAIFRKIQGEQPPDTNPLKQKFLEPPMYSINLQFCVSFVTWRWVHDYLLLNNNNNNNNKMANLLFNIKTSALNLPSQIQLNYTGNFNAWLHKKSTNHWD